MTSPQEFEFPILMNVNGGDGDESSDNEVAYTCKEVLDKLEEAWLNEKFAPDLLVSQNELVECLLEQIQEMEENIRRCKRNEFKVSLHSLEVDRVRYVVSSYLRCRLKKIEKFTQNVLANEEEARNGGSASKLSEGEYVFAKEYSESIEGHLQNLALRHMPQNMQPINPRKTDHLPNLDEYVFLKVNMPIEGGLLVEEETLEAGMSDEQCAPDQTAQVAALGATLVAKWEEYVDVEKGDQLILKYRNVAPLTKHGEISLI